MKVYTCNSFAGHWPVGTAAVVAAENADLAAGYLNWKLEEIGLAANVTAEQMDEFKLDEGQVAVLNDGDY